MKLARDIHETDQGLECPLEQGNALTCRHGWTLLEMLVTMSVIGVLITLLLPGLQRARALALGTGCRENLRQWGLATQLYTLDYGDYLPYDGAPNGISQRRAWYAELPLQVGERPYMEQPEWRTNAEANLPRSIWLCPANSRRSNGNALFHYCLNRHINGSGSESRRVRLTDLLEPSRLVWLYDNGGLAAVASIRNLHTNLHRKGAHILFLDGHVAQVPSTEWWDERRRNPIMETPRMLWNPAR